jgi:hypothetical protein
LQALPWGNSPIATTTRAVGCVVTYRQMIADADFSENRKSVMPITAIGSKPV